MWVRTAKLTGRLMIAASAVLVLVVSYQLWLRPAAVGREQDQLDDQLARSWRADAAPTVPGPAAPGSPTVETDDAEGNPFARLHIPRLNLRWAVVEGVTDTDLDRGPGHYPTTAAPGSVGNFAVAGHRMRGMFWDLDRLGHGDAIVVETADDWFVYRVSESLVVSPADGWVVAANPARPADPPDRRLLTLTTCEPKLADWQRLIIHAELTTTQPKSVGRPEELTR
jgi:sortase A